MTIQTHLNREVYLKRLVDNPIWFNRNDSLNRNFFSVREMPVQFEHPNQPGRFDYYPDRKVLINMSTGKAISLVRDNFLVVEHNQAFELGVHLFEMLFGVKPSIHKEYLSLSTTDYLVDFISESCRFELDIDGYRYINRRRSLVESENLTQPDYIESFSATALTEGVPHINPAFKDEYRPFLRVTNFLRGNNSFYIEIGFYRSRCTNGMLLGMRSQTSFKHSYYTDSFLDIKKKALDFFHEHNRKMFGTMDRVWKLLTIPIPVDRMHLVCFDIYQDELMKKSHEERLYLQQTIKDLSEAYAKEIGENMNAALNVATDIAKRWETGKSSQNKIQRRAALFLHRYTTKSFRVDAYLKSIADIEQHVMTAKRREDNDIIDEAF